MKKGYLYTANMAGMEKSKSKQTDNLKRLKALVGLLKILVNLPPNDAKIKIETGSDDITYLTFDQRFKIHYEGPGEDAGKFYIGYGSDKRFMCLSWYDEGEIQQVANFLENSLSCPTIEI